METVTFRVSKSGVWHFKDFKLNDKGLIDPQVVGFMWTGREDCPVIEKESTVEEVLEIFKNFAYGNKASIYRKDRLPVLIDEDVLKDVKESVKTVEETLRKEAQKIFKNHLYSILGRFKVDFLDILILKDKKWVSLSKDLDKHFAVNYVCHKLLYGLGKVESDSFDCETGYIKDYFDYFISDLEETK